MIHATPAHRALARHRRNANAIRLYWWLGFELDPVEYRPVKIAEMAKGLGMDRGDVSRALAILVSFDLIHRNGRAWARGPYTYRLVPNPRPTVGIIPTTDAA